MNISVNLMNVADTLDGSLRIMRDAGFQGIDFSFCEQWDKPEKFLSEEYRQELLSLAKNIREVGMEFPQCHLPYLPGDVVIGDGTYQAFEDWFLPMYIRSLEICSEIGCRVAVIHLYFEKDAQATFLGNIALMKKLLPYLEQYDVTLAIENIFGGGQAYENCHISLPEDILRYVTELNHPKIGICLDTGHANLFKLNVVEMARRYGSHLVAMHIHGNGGEDEHLVPGLAPTWVDFTDYYELAKALKEIGYPGSFNLEIGFSTLPMRARKYFVSMAYEAAFGYVNP